MLRSASLYGRTHLLPDDLHDKAPVALQQAKDRLIRADGETIIEVIELIFETLNQELPNEKQIATWIHLLAEYPEDILRASARDMLKKHFGKPVPADLCRYAQPRLDERTRDLHRLSTCYFIHKRDGVPLPEPEQLEAPNAARRIAN